MPVRSFLSSILSFLLLLLLPLPLFFVFSSLSFFLAICLPVSFVVSVLSLVLDICLFLLFYLSCWLSRPPFIYSLVPLLHDLSRPVTNWSRVSRENCEIECKLWHQVKIVEWVKIAKSTKNCEIKKSRQSRERNGCSNDLTPFISKISWLWSYASTFILHVIKTNR